MSSIDSTKKAQLLDKARGAFAASAAAEGNESGVVVDKVGVHVQVNTSGEESKSGCSPGAEVLELSKFVLTECPNLKLVGFMTIGAIARSVATTAETENEDFRVLKEQRDLVAEELKELLGGGREELELSMGMSEDFEGAIAMGSSEVRVGSTIFGSRPAKADAKIVV